MKLYINLVLLIIAFSLNSCCKRSGYPIAEVDVQYTNLSIDGFAYDIRTSRSDFEDIIDTIKLPGESTYWSSNTGFKVRLLLDGEVYNHILMTMDLSRIDTISQITVNRDKCEKIEEIEYLWNGVYSTDTYREVN